TYGYRCDAGVLGAALTWTDLGTACKAQRVRSSALFVLFLLSLSLGTAPETARADAQASARGALGFGKRKADAGDEFITTLNISADLLFGPPRHGSFRFGPTIEARTTD